MTIAYGTFPLTSIGQSPAEIEKVTVNTSTKARDSTVIEYTMPMEPNTADVGERDRGSTWYKDAVKVYVPGTDAFTRIVRVSIMLRPLGSDLKIAAAIRLLALVPTTALVSSHVELEPVTS